MRIRGDIFWTWADPAFQHRSHEENLANGPCVDVQVRLSRTGNTQMFIGVYSSSGMTGHEEVFDSRRGESMTRALSWGVGRADELPKRDPVLRLVSQP
ncbi:hypothetical protein [Pseudomonas sp. zfem002]|uniref:hypothetical protein n=1 Tax=Pseudomonas sp. zfem002 TaxID=3078197 RepID=UPI002928A0F8|nr:hypothetical protein [Pseudomonas sp. zfem002]MDU9393538.1 hypothetical protein [Pseudomonas sp. zfem002]